MIKLGASAIIDRDGKILLGRRELMDEALPGLWCTPGGGVEFRETVAAAIKREVYEEVGLTVTYIYADFVSIQERIGERHTVILFRHANALGEAKAGDGFDIVSWFAPDEIENMFFLRMITPSTEEALREFFIAERK